MGATMEQYLTELGKNVVRKLCYDLNLKKYQLKRSDADISGYEIQALQQREIALNDIFESLITAPADNVDDENLFRYYDYLAENNKPLKPFKDNGKSWQDYLTEDGVDKLLSMYREDIIAKQAAWHDGIFEYMPKTEDIADIKPASVNWNFIERQQGYKIAMRALKAPKDKIIQVEKEVRDSVYTMELNDNWQSEYKLLASADKHND